MDLKIKLILGLIVKKIRLIQILGKVDKKLV